MKLNILLERLKNEELTLIVERKEDIYTSTLKGIAPILNPLKNDRHFFEDAIVVDKVIGKAAAMLLILSNVQYIYAFVMSQKAKDILDKYHIKYDYEKIVDYIINRDQNGMCPMEQTVYDIDDLEVGYQLLIAKQEQLLTQMRS